MKGRNMNKQDMEGVIDIDNLDPNFDYEGNLVSEDSENTEEENQHESETEEATENEQDGNTEDEQTDEDEGEESEKEEESEESSTEEAEKPKKRVPRAQKRIQTLAQQKNELKKKLEEQAKELEEYRKKTSEYRKTQSDTVKKSLESRVQSAKERVEQLEKQFENAKELGDSDTAISLSPDLAEARMLARQAQQEFESYTPEDEDETSDNSAADESDNSQNESPALVYGQAWAEDRMDDLQSEENKNAVNYIGEELKKQGLNPEEEIFWETLDGYFEKYLDNVESQTVKQKPKGVTKPKPPAAASGGRRTPAGSGGKVALTESEKQTAKKLGISYDDFRKQKQAKNNGFGYEIEV